MKDRFIEQDGLLFLKCEPESLETDSKMPCLAQPIQNDSRMGKINRISFKNNLERFVIHDMVNYISDGYYLRFEIIAKHCPEGSREWALWQMLNEKTVQQVSKYKVWNNDIYHQGLSGSWSVLYPIERWLISAAPTGWQIYEEPKPKPEVGKWYWNKVRKEYCYAIKLNDDVMEMRSAGSLGTYGFDVMEIDDLVETSLEPDFNNAKVGDKCFSAVEGNGTVMKALDLFVDFPVKSQRFCKYIKYQRNGKLYEASIHPTLFHSAAQCAAYFAEVALEERGEE